MSKRTKEIAKKGRVMWVFEKVLDEIDRMSHRSAWDRGVNDYAYDLVLELKEDVEDGWLDLDDLRSPQILDKRLLNGADNWYHYSMIGNALCYDGQIAERLCTPSQLKRSNNGQRRIGGKSWLEHQARALYQAQLRVKSAFNTVWRLEG